ncbi:MAG: amino acid ABC transporter permease [Spirochaetales bacterium]|nr:amino acid ABC transporter permease [Spirochaetales bacterium]
MSHFRSDGRTKGHTPSDTAPEAGDRTAVGASRGGRLVPVGSGLFRRLPWWLLAAIVLAVVFIWNIVGREDYRVILRAVSRGILTSIYVSIVAFVMATALGLAVGLLRVSTRRVVRESATFYVEIIRGIPMLVILYYIAFVGAPVFVAIINTISSPLRWVGLSRPITVRELDFTWRAILALTIGYSAFISEIIRAGIESIHRGQLEAAHALGMSRWRAMRSVILPQAIRNVLPPMGNEFVAMIKDSALVSALGVQDITQLGRIYSTSTFRFFETYNVVAFLYLIMTVTLSLLVRRLETRLGAHRRRD